MDALQGLMCFASEYDCDSRLLFLQSFLEQWPSFTAVQHVIWSHPGQRFNQFLRLIHVHGSPYDFSPLMHVYLPSDPYHCALYCVIRYKIRWVISWSRPVAIQLLEANDCEGKKKLSLRFFFVWEDLQLCEWHLKTFSRSCLHYEGFFFSAAQLPSTGQENRDFKMKSIWLILLE